MYGEVHANRVFYKNAPAPGHRFKQVALHELDTFIVIVGEGEVVHDVLQFQATNPDAEAYIFDNLGEAQDEVANQCRMAEQEGWIPYPGA